MRTIKLVLVMLFSIVVAACGGGGSGGSSTPAPPVVVVDPNLTVPLQSAMANLVNNGLSLPYTVSGWNGPAHTPISGSGTLTIGRPTSVKFTSGPLIGVTALKSVAVAGTSSATYYYNLADYTLLALTYSTYNFLYTPYTILSTVKAGDTGAIGSSSTGGALASTTTGFYSVASDRADSLLVTFSETETLWPGISKSVTSTTYRISTTGAITLVSVTVDYYSSGAYIAQTVRTF